MFVKSESDRERAAVVQNRIGNLVILFTKTLLKVFQQEIHRQYVEHVFDGLNNMDLGWTRCQDDSHWSTKTRRTQKTFTCVYR